MSTNYYKLLLGLFRKPPQFILRRLKREFVMLMDRYFYVPAHARYQAKNLNEPVLLKELLAPDLDTLWERLSKNPYPTFTAFYSGSGYDKICPGDERVFSPPPKKS